MGCDDRSCRVLGLVLVPWGERVQVIKYVLIQVQDIRLVAVVVADGISTNVRIAC